MAGKYLLLHRLNKKLQKNLGVAEIERPEGGWIREIRRAMGMTAAQLADRLAVSRPRVHQLEAAEVSGAVSIKTMRDAAATLGCDFVYALVPRGGSLEAIVIAQAKKVAREEMAKGALAFKNGELATEAQLEAYEELIAELVGKMPRELWGVPKKSQI